MTKAITGQARWALAVKLQKQYDQGASIRQLAAGCGRSYSFVHRLLIEVDTTLRPHGSRSNFHRKVKRVAP